MPLESLKGVKVTRKRQGEPTQNWPTPPPPPPPAALRLPANPSSQAVSSLHIIQQNYGHNSSSEEDEVDDQFCGGESYGQEEEFYHPEEDDYSGEECDETGEIPDKSGGRPWSKQDYEEADNGRQLVSKKSEGVEAENALRQLSVNSSIQVNRVPGNKPSSGPEAPPVQKNILDASRLSQYLSQQKAENKGKKADFPKNASPLSRAPLDQHLVKKSHHVPMNQPHHSPINQPHHASGNQSHHTPINQQRHGPVNQPHHSPVNQPHHSPLNQPHHGSINQPHHGPMNQPQHAPVNQSHHGPANQPTGRSLSVSKTTIQSSPPVSKAAPTVSAGMPRPSPAKSPIYAKHPPSKLPQTFIPQPPIMRGVARGEMQRLTAPMRVSHSRRARGFRSPASGRRQRIATPARQPISHMRLPFFKGPPRSMRPQGHRMSDPMQLRGRATNRRRAAAQMHSPITKIPKSITVSKAHAQQQQQQQQQIQQQQQQQIQQQQQQQQQQQMQQHEHHKLKDLEEPPYMEEDEDEEGEFYDEEDDGGWFEEEEDYQQHRSHYDRAYYRNIPPNARGRFPSQYAEWPRGAISDGMEDDEELEEEEEDYEMGYEVHREMEEAGFQRKEVGLPPHMDKGEPSSKGEGRRQEHISFMKDTYDEDSFEGYAEYPEELEDDYEEPEMESDPENAGEVEGAENKLPYLRGVTVSVQRAANQLPEKGMVNVSTKQRIPQEGKFSHEAGVPELKNYQDVRKQIQSSVPRWRESVSSRLQSPLRRSPRGRTGSRFPPPRMNHPHLVSSSPQAQNISPIKYPGEKDGRPVMVQQVQMVRNSFPVGANNDGVSESPGGVLSVSNPNMNRAKSLVKKDTRIVQGQPGNSSVIMIFNKDARSLNNNIPGDLNPQTVIMMNQAAARSTATITELPSEEGEVQDALGEEEKRKGAFCNHCGFIGENFSRCSRCNQKLPDNVRIIELPLMFPVEGKPALLPGRNTRGQAKKQKQQQDEEPECFTLSSDEEDNSPTSDQSPQEGEPDNTVPESTEDQTVIAEYKDLLMKIDKGGLAPPYTLLDCISIRVGNYKGPPRDRVILTDSNIHICLPPVDELKQLEGRTVIIKIPNDEITEVQAHLGPKMPVLFLTLDPAAAKQIRTTLRMVEKCNDKPRVYYDPSSSDQREIFITLILDGLKNENAVVIRQIFNKPPSAEKSSGRLLTEIELDMANVLLKSSAPVEVERRDAANRTIADGEPQTLLVWPPRPYKDGIPINTDDYCCLEDEQFLNDVIIDFYLKYLHLECLQENDRLRTHIFSSYFYRRLTTKPTRMRRSHPVEDDPNLTPAQKRHARVKGWTKNVDIFEKDFIVIPINEHAHWFLAIICFPYLEGPVTMEGNIPVTDPKLLKNPPKSKKKQKLSDATEMKPIQIGSTTIVPVNQTLIKAEQLLDPELSDRDEAEGDSSEMEDEDDEQPIPSQEEPAGTEENEEPAEPTAEAPPEEDKKEVSAETNSEEAVSSTVPSETTVEPETKTTTTVTTTISAVTSTTTAAPAVTVSASATPPLPKQEQPKKCSSPPPTYEPIKMPCILIFDSLAGPGANRYRTVATLRDYLTVEWEAKKGTTRKFTRDSIKGASPKVPQQTNFSDCGIYLLHYAESFFTNPLNDYRIPIRKLQDWFPIEEAMDKRQNICDLIKKFVIRHNPANLEKIPLLKMYGEDDDDDLEEEEEDLEEEEDDCDEELPLSPGHLPELPELPPPLPLLQEEPPPLPPPPPLPNQEEPPPLPVNSPMKRETEDSECEEKEPKRLKLSKEDDR